MHMSRGPYEDPEAQRGDPQEDGQDDRPHHLRSGDVGSRIHGGDACAAGYHRIGGSE